VVAWGSSTQVDGHAADAGFSMLATAGGRKAGWPSDRVLMLILRCRGGPRGSVTGLQQLAIKRVEPLK
jgi:hypothetical protein